MCVPVVAMLALCASIGVAEGPGEATSLVVPIDWKRFDQKVPSGKDAQVGARIFLDSIRYNLAWMSRTFKEAARGDRYVIARMDEPGIRPPTSAAYAIAVALQTGVYDEKAVGLSATQAQARIVKLMQSLAAAHKVNGAPQSGWGDTWQSALWAALLGNAGWLIWNDLDAPTQRMLCTAVVHEADRFVRPGYRVPYWNGQGGDTKAEENAWNAMVIHVAVAMMPRHPHAARWKRIGSELMVSAFSLKRDMESNETVVDGKPVKAWLRGYNVRDDGAVVNHGFVHPDYMTCVLLNLRAILTQSLAGRPIPESAEFNAALIYRSLVTHKWPSPPYEPPGGTIYIPGKADVYYPMGTDWSRYRFDAFYMIDVFAHLLQWDKHWPHHAADWMRLRAERIRQMQSRHTDGRMFAKGEFDTYAGCEQMAAWVLADAFLLQWLYAQEAISKRSNWNAF